MFAFCSVLCSQNFARNSLQMVANLHILYIHIYLAVSKRKNCTTTALTFVIRVCIENIKFYLSKFLCETHNAEVLEDGFLSKCAFV